METLNNRIEEQWLTSKQMQQQLKISGCKLMHLRESDALTFKKIGNVFYYLQKSRSNERLS